MSQNFRNCPVSCPIAASAQPQRTWLSWTLSATTTALILSAASALALTSNPAPIVDQPIFLILPPAPAAADTMAAISDPAPIASSEAPTPPQLEADAPEPTTQPDPLPDLPKPQPVAKNLPHPMAAPEQLADAKPQMDAPQPQPDLLPAPDALPAAADPAPIAPEQAKPMAEPAKPEKAEAKPKKTKPEPEKTTKTKPKKPDDPAPKKTAKANSAPSAGGAAAPSKAAKATAQGQSPAAYTKAVMKKIRGTKKRSSPGKGSAVVGFVIASNGRLSLVKIVNSSGSAALDAAAVDHIQRSAPFAPPPAGASTKFSFEFVGK